MHITRYSDYALRVLIYLAAEPERVATIQAISESYGISRSHLMKVVNRLNQLGYVQATRGKNGGLRLGQPPAQINVGELFRRTEPDLDLVECFTASDRCAITPVCKLKHVFHDAREAFLSVLDDYTLADLVAPEHRHQLMQILNIT